MLYLMIPKQIILPSYDVTQTKLNYRFIDYELYYKFT